MTLARLSVAAIAVFAFSAVASGASIAADDTVRVTLKDHRFSPAHVSAPAGQRFRIEVANQGAAPAEFESSDLRAEKIVVPGGKISVFAGPLKPGTYNFFDDYDPEQAKGTLTVPEQTGG